LEVPVKIIGAAVHKMTMQCVYFRFHQTNTGRIVTANCDPRSR